MKPKEPVETGQHDIFRSRLDQVIDMGNNNQCLQSQLYCLSDVLAQ